MVNTKWIVRLRLLPILMKYHFKWLIIRSFSNYNSIIENWNSLDRLATCSVEFVNANSQMQFVAAWLVCQTELRGWWWGRSLWDHKASPEADTVGRREPHPQYLKKAKITKTEVGHTETQQFDFIISFWNGTRQHDEKFMGQQQRAIQICFEVLKQTC